MTSSAESRPRNAQATRTDLLRAAQRRFTVLGYDRTTTRDIAADAGVNVSLIKRYFGSKDGLFAAVLHEYTETLDDDAPRDAGAFVDSLLAGLEPGAWPEFGGEHPLLLLLRGAGDDRVDELRRRALTSSITRIGDQFSSSPDARLRSELLMAFFAGVVMLRAALPDEPLATSDAESLRVELERMTAAIVG